ncbi:Pr6Pr family membrane protein [Actinokineospora sp. NPDC004072]
MHRASRSWFGLTALVALVGLGAQTWVAATTGPSETVAGRVFTMLCYFTIQSNIIVCATHAMLARDPDRGGWVFAVFRVAGLIGIIVTGLVYHAVLRGLYDLSGLAHFADLLLHTATPLLTVAGWLLFGPRGRISATTAAAALLFPALYLVLTLVRGPIAEFYPYPFIDVTELGYGTVLLNSLVVAALFLALALGALGVDRLLTRRTAAAGSPRTRSAPTGRSRP